MADDFDDELDALLLTAPVEPTKANTSVDINLRLTNRFLPQIGVPVDKPRSENPEVKSLGRGADAYNNTYLKAVNYKDFFKVPADVNEEDPDASAFSNQSFSSRPSSSKSQRDLFGNIVSQGSASTPAAPVIPEKPTHHPIDHEELKSYIYPINYELRDYQFNIIKKSFFHNTLVALPTGLGKTFIAATVILNYFRWFPESKIIFMAPTKPLVAQQIKACFEIVGMKDQFAILLDKLKRNRLEIWSNYKIFFTTPQVVENDLTNGLVDPKSISLLIIDEAHKAKGNYAYNNVVKFMNRFNTSYRILALTATPSGTVEGIKEIIENLNISKIEIRTENSIDIIKYFKNKKIEKIDINSSQDDIIATCLEFISNLSSDYVDLANERKLFTINDPTKLYAFMLLDISKKNLASNLSENLKWSNHFLLKLLVFIATCVKKLKIYGFNNFKSYFMENREKTLKSKNKLMLELFHKPEMDEFVKYITETTDIMHPKITTLISHLRDFFKTVQYNSSKVIIFTEFRDSALEIVTAIESMKDESLKPHIFIGQAPDNKSKGDDDRKRTSSETAKLKGMKQNVQKQLIKDFKGSKFNILVATSIGEEGLDIGEVDLIICYDSTSSPIKNVQRLGRTGRKRDGNILMLFSDNERSKFEKAMDNYEWIQRYIMSHEAELVAGSRVTRIIPPGITPELVKKFIAPDDTFANEDDDDEIIKIAMNYMKKKPKKSTKKTKKDTKESKIMKKFFMPDNVETGFRKVTELVKKPQPESPPSLPELIDAEEFTSSAVKRGKVAQTQISDDDFSDEEYFRKRSKHSPPGETYETSPPAEPYKPTPSDLKPVQPPSEPLAEPELATEPIEPPTEPIEPLTEPVEPPTEPAEPLTEPVEPPTEPVEPFTEAPDDDFDDGLDTVLRDVRKAPSDPLVDNQFSSEDGLLSPEEKMELFTNYYNPLPTEPVFHKPESIEIRPLSSTVSRRLHSLLQKMGTIDNEIASNELRNLQKNVSEDSTPSITEYLNNKLA